MKRSQDLRMPRLTRRLVTSYTDENEEVKEPFTSKDTSSSPRRREWATLRNNSPFDYTLRYEEALKKKPLPIARKTATFLKEESPRSPNRDEGKTSRPLETTLSQASMSWLSPRELFPSGASIEEVSSDTESSVTSLDLEENWRSFYYGDSQIPESPPMYFPVTQTAGSPPTQSLSGSMDTTDRMLPLLTTSLESARLDCSCGCWTFTRSEWKSKAVTPPGTPQRSLSPQTNQSTCGMEGRRTPPHSREE